MSLEPLSRAETLRILQARMGFETLPPNLVSLITEKAEGNALFAEELASFLLERGVVRQWSGRLEYEENTVAAAMPASVQSLLTARVDQLAPNDRALLQIAAAIGRRFDANLLKAVAGSTVPSNELLKTMKRLDLVYEDVASGEHSFKHALVRDALYGSLLAGSRSVLHLKIADEIERRSNNRLVETAEVLAHHYGQTEQANKAFLYLAMAARKSLGVYSLEEAEKFCRLAMSLLTENPACAGDEAVAELLSDYTLVMRFMLKINTLLKTLEPWLFRVDRLGNHRLSIVIFHNYVYALVLAARHQEARTVHKKLSSMAKIVCDDASTVYAFTAKVFAETILGPVGADELAAEVGPMMAAALRSHDGYLSIWLHWVLGWDALHRGLILDCYSYARKLIEIGRRLDDPRALSFGLWLMGYAAVVLDDHPAALRYAEESLDGVKTPFDRNGATSVKAIALVMLRRLDEGGPILQQCRQDNTASGQHYQNVGLDAFWGVVLVLRGSFGAGIRQIKKIIAEQELKGYQAAADWHRMTLSEIYLEILEAKQAPALNVLIRNLAAIVRLKLFGLREIDQMMKVALANPQFAPESSAHSKMNFTLGRRARLAGDRVRAKMHLEKARKIACQYGDTPLLRKIEAQMVDP
jgi:hypothetical protein